MAMVLLSLNSRVFDRPVALNDILKVLLHFDVSMLWLSGGSSFSMFQQSLATLVTVSMVA